MLDTEVSGVFEFVRLFAAEGDIGGGGFRGCALGGFELDFTSESTWLIGLIGKCHHLIGMAGEGLASEVGAVVIKLGAVDAAGNIK